MSTAMTASHLLQTANCKSAGKFYLSATAVFVLNRLDLTVVGLRWFRTEKISHVILSSKLRLLSTAILRRMLRRVRAASISCYEYRLRHEQTRDARCLEMFNNNIPQYFVTVILQYINIRYFFNFYHASYASAVYVVTVCPSVCLSVTSRSSTKMAKPRITQTKPYDSPGTL